MTSTLLVNFVPALAYRICLALSAHHATLGFPVSRALYNTKDTRESDSDKKEVGAKYHPNYANVE